jgi:hypothetical protein
MRTIKQKSSLERNGDLLGGALERGGKLLEGCQSLEQGGSSPLCGSTLERSGGFARGWLVHLFDGLQRPLGRSKSWALFEFRCG